MDIRYRGLTDGFVPSRRKGLARLRAYPLFRNWTLLLLFSGIVGCGSGDSENPGTHGETISTDGVTITYEVHGEGEPALVLIHGWTNSIGIWGRHPYTLSRNHQVVALDLAGHGKSGADRSEWTMDAFGEDVVAVVNELNLERVVLIGFSLGGYVALEAAERIPERVLGIVFVDAIHNPEMNPAPAHTEQMITQFRAAWGDPAFLRAFAFTPDAPDSLIEYVAGMMPAQPHEHWFAILRSVHEWVRTEFRPALARVSVPTAAINTTRQPTDLEAIQRYIPSFTVDTLSGVGHAGILLQRVEDFDARLLSIVERFSFGINE